MNYGTLFLISMSIPCWIITIILMQRFIKQTNKNPFNVSDSLLISTALFFVISIILLLFVISAIIILIDWPTIIAWWNTEL